MADYGTTYIFRIDIEGKEAVAAAVKLRKDLDAAISGGQTTIKEVARLRDAYHGLAHEAIVVGKAITSITRRMTYQRKGMAATEQSILKLGTHYHTLLQMMTQEASEPFDAMVQAALNAQNKITGNSIIPDMVYQAIEFFRQLRFYGVGTFEAIAMAAAAAADATKHSFSETMDVQVRGMDVVPSTDDPDIVAIGRDPYAAIATGAKEAAEEVLTLGDAINAATIQHFGMRRIGYGLAYSGRVIARAGEALTGALMGASEAYLEFEQRATIAGVAMEMQADQIDDLEKAVLKTSIALALFSPEELLEGTRQWAAGTGVVIESQEDLNKLMAETIAIQKMAALNSVDLGKSVDTVGGVMHEFGLETKDVTHITEVLNYVAAKTFANVLDVGDAFKMVGPIAAQLGVSMEEVAVTIGLVSDANIKGSRAGRALRQMFQRLLKPTREYDAMMQNLLKNSLKTGQSWKDLIMPGGVFVGMAEYFDILAAATEGYTSAERAATLAVLATANELPALVHLVERTIDLRREGKSLVEEELAAILDAHGLMTRSFETLEQSESYRVEQMRRRWEAATLEMGGAVQKNMLPYMEEWYDWITGIVEQLTENPEILKWLALGGFGLQGVGAAVGGMGEAINIAANIAIMATAVDKFGGWTKLFANSVATLAGLKFLIPIAYTAALWKSAQDVISETEKMGALEERYPATVQERFYQEAFVDRTNAGLGLMVARSEELRDIFQELFGEQWVRASAENINKVLNAMAPMLGPQVPGAAVPAAAARGISPAQAVLPGYEIPNLDEALMQYLQYLERVEEVTESYYARKQALIDKHIDREWDVLQDYLQKEEERTEKHYLVLTRAAEDYQVRLERLESTHLLRMEDLIARRDARGMLREVRSYQDRRTTTTEDYEKTRSRRVEDYERQQEEAREQFYLLREERQVALDEQLSDLKEAWQEQLEVMKEAEQEKLAALIEAETKMEAYLREHYDTLLADFKTFLADYDTIWEQFAAEPLVLPILLKTGIKPEDGAGPPPAYYRWEQHRLPEGMQEGGYAYGGVYTLGEAGREFVLSAPTTRAAERQLGAPLGQAAFGGAGGGRIVVDQSNWRFEGSFTEGDKVWFREAAKEAAYEGIVEVVGG